MKKGFTLAELLGVIVILGVIATIITLVITNNIRQARILACDAQAKSLLEGFKVYLTDHPELNHYPTTKTISNLKELGYFDNEDIINPVTGKKYSDETKIAVICGKKEQNQTERAKSQDCEYLFLYKGQDDDSCGISNSSVTQYDGDICIPEIESVTYNSFKIKLTCNHDNTEYIYYMNNSAKYSGSNNEYTFKDTFDLSKISIKVKRKADSTPDTFTLSDDELIKGYNLIYEALNAKYNSLDKTINSSCNKMYPTNSIYITTTEKTAAEVKNKLGCGTWAAYAQGRTLVGVGSNGTTNYATANATGGSETVTLALTNLASHVHSVTPTGTITSTFKGNQGTLPNAGAHVHTFHAYETGRESGGHGMEGHAAFQNRVRVGGQLNSATDTTSWVGDHTHSYTAKGSVSSKFTGSSVTTNSQGSNTAFNIMNPYIVTYIWKRTA